MHDTPDPTPARLLLLAAVSITRQGSVDGYALARLAQHGYTREQVELAAQALVDIAVTAAETAVRQEAA